MQDYNAFGSDPSLILMVLTNEIQMSAVSTVRMYRFKDVSDKHAYLPFPFPTIKEEKKFAQDLSKTIGPEAKAAVRQNFIDEAFRNSAAEKGVSVRDLTLLCDIMDSTAREHEQYSSTNGSGDVGKVFSAIVGAVKRGSKLESPALQSITSNGMDMLITVSEIFVREALMDPERADVAQALAALEAFKEKKAAGKLTIVEEAKGAGAEVADASRTKAVTTEPKKKKEPRKKAHPERELLRDQSKAVCLAMEAGGMAEEARLFSDAIDYLLPTGRDNVRNVKSAKHATSAVVTMDRAAGVLREVTHAVLTHVHGSGGDDPAVRSLGADFAQVAAGLSVLVGDKSKPCVDAIAHLDSELRPDGVPGARVQALMAARR